MTTPTPNDLPSVGTEDGCRHGVIGYCTECNAVHKIQAIISERDDLAARVRELEGERDAAPLRLQEQRAVLDDPGMLVRLIGYHDAQEAAGEAMEEGWGKYHERRALELLAIGRKVIAEDPGIWEPEIIAEFKPRHSERAALTASKGQP